MENNIITINGIKYKPVDRTPSNRSSKAFTRLMAISMIFGGMPSLGYSKKRPNVNIAKEYELIQNKQSKLSRNDRDRVEKTFHYNYTQIIEN